MPYGNIIFLNGISSSGKSTLAKELQQLLEQPYIHMSLDDVWARLPEKIVGQDQWWTKLSLGQFVSGFHNAVVGFSRAGVGVIIDHCCTSKSGLQECLQLFKDARVVFVDVTCSIDELKRREKTRGDRMIGQAEAQLKRVLAFRSRHLYDLQVDTSVYCPIDCARKIIGVLSDAIRETAFGQMRNRNAQQQGGGDAKYHPPHPGD